MHVHDIILFILHLLFLKGLSYCQNLRDILFMPCLSVYKSHFVFAQKLEVPKTWGSFYLESFQTSYNDWLCFGGWVGQMLRSPWLRMQKWLRFVNSSSILTTVFRLLLLSGSFSQTHHLVYIDIEQVFLLSPIFQCL